MHFEHWMWDPIIAGGIGFYGILRAALLAGYARDTRLALVEREVKELKQAFHDHLRDHHDWSG